MLERWRKDKKSGSGDVWTDYLQWASRPTELAQCQDFRPLLEQKPFQALYQLAMSGEAQGQQVLKQLAGALGELDGFQRALAAHLCGALIEHWGMNPAADQRIVEAFAEMVVQSCEFLACAQAQLGCREEEFDEAKLREADWGALFAQEPDRTRAFWGCDLLTLAVMAVITRDQAARLLLRDKGIYQHLDYLVQFKEKVHYVQEVYQACPQMAITVLAPKTGHGLRLLINDINNCFHLFTLLEAEFYHRGWLDDLEGYQWRRDIDQIAKGLVLPQTDASITAHQQYYTVQAVQPDGSYQVTIQTEQGLQIDPAALVWGEMPPEAIVPFAGERIIIVDKEGMFAGRSWDISFIVKCHDALQPDLQVKEVLSEAECQTLWEKIKQRQA